MDKLTSIKTFHAVVKHKSFSQAAEALGISPQLVSKYVSTLEAELGLRLINRTTRRLNLTSEGSSYYEESVKIVESLEALETRITDMKLSPSGLLRISAPVSLGSQRLGTIVGDFIAKYPDMSVDIQLNDRKVDIIDEGFDVALRIGSLVDSSLIAKRLAPVDVFVCASTGYIANRGEPKSLADLSQHRILKYSYLSNQREFEGNDAPIISNSGELLSKAAKTGAGVVMAPRYIVQNALDSGELKKLFSVNDTENLALYAVYPHRTLVSIKVRAFVDHLSEVFAQQSL
jgi:DNA-binding transcriptional LysR family regulator